MSLNRLQALACAAALMAASPLIQAQGTKPAPAKAAPAKGEAPKMEAASKMMTRDELRACMKLADDTKALAASLESRKAELAADKLKIAPASEELKAPKEELNRLMAEVKEADNAVKVHAQKIDVWNAEFEEVKASTMKSAEQRKKQLQGERAALEATNKQLVDVRAAKFKDYEAAAERFNVKAKGLDAMVQSWNQRNEKLYNDSEAVLEMKANYGADCANRRFKEEDEEAIKKGK